MKRLVMICTIIGCLLGLNMNVKADTNAEVMGTTNQENSLRIDERNGILLDIARFPMTKNQIEEVIDQMKPQKFSYLVLHLNDNEHVAFQSKLLGNTKAAGTLSATDLKEIVKYGSKHGILLVADFDTPGHCTELVKLIKKEHPNLAKKIIADDESLNYQNQTTVKFVEQIYSEINACFKEQPVSYILMGGDEVAGGIQNNSKLITYFNKLNAYENKHGFKTIVWNDALRKKNKLNKKITVVYWSQSGNMEEKRILKERAKKRANVTELKQHPLINANSVYNYFMMNKLDNETDVDEFVKNFKQNDPHNFNEINEKTMQNDAQTKQDNIKTSGQLVCLWEGESQKNNVKQIIDFVKKLNE